MLTSTQMTRRAGITYRQLDHWIRAGVLECEVDARGSGSSRQFSEHEAFVARSIGDLVALGLPLSAASFVGRQLRMRAMEHGQVFVDAGGGLSRDPWHGACYVLDLDDLHRGLADAMASR